MFDELLNSQSFLCRTRGNGTLILDKNYWYIGQYYLSFPIPNPLAQGMCKQIADFEAQQNAQKLLNELKLDDKSKDENKAKQKG